MINFIWTNAGWFILVYYVLAMRTCLELRNRDAGIMAAFLTLLELSAWIDEIWGNPVNLMFVHLTIFTLLCLFVCVGNALQGKISDVLALIAIGFVLTDAVFIVSRVDMPQIHLAIVNILFISALYYTRKGGYNAIQSLKEAGEKSGAGNDTTANMDTENVCLLLGRLGRP